MRIYRGPSAVPSSGRRARLGSTFLEGFRNVLVLVNELMNTRAITRITMAARYAAIRCS